MVGMNSEGIMAFILAIFLWASPLIAEITSPGLELVVTAPVETKLTKTDLRSTQEVWLELIDAAKISIDFGQMYVNSKAGEPLERVLEALEKAGRRGVKIRFLLEEKMLHASDLTTIERLKKIPNLTLRIFPVAKMSEGGIFHAKYFIVDKTQAYLGSANFDWRSLKHIHETGVKIFDDTLVRDLQSLFEFDWRAFEILEKGKVVAISPAKATKATKKRDKFLIAGPKSFLPKGIPAAEEEIPNLLAEAKEEIRIQLLDYYPLNRDKTFYPVLDNALRAAQARGVKIRLLVSHWNSSKPGIDHLKSLSILPNTEVKIMTVPEANEGFISFARVNHSKFVVIDKEIGIIGTSNWSGGYFDKTRSVELVVRDGAMAKRLRGLHDQLWNSSLSEPIEVDYEYPLPKKE